MHPRRGAGGAEAPFEHGLDGEGHEGHEGQERGDREGGRDVSTLPPYERDVNTVFQDYALFPHMTVAENVGYGLKVLRVAREERLRRVEEALAMVRLP